MKALIKNYRQSPRKVRLVANLMKGKSISGALSELKFLPKRAAYPIEKLISSAVANAKVAGSDPENLIIKSVTVNKGFTLKRMMPRARGSGAPINKRTSHILVTLGEKTENKKEILNKIKKVEEKPKVEKKPKAKKIAKQNS